MPTVRNPESPFAGGVSQSQYSLAEDAYYASLEALQALSDGDLLTEAALQAGLANTSTAAGNEALGRLWAANHELRRRRLPQRKITA